MKVLQVESTKNVLNYTRGSSEAEIKSLVFNGLDDSFLIFLTSHDSLHIFDLEDKYKSKNESRSLFNKFQSGYSYYWSGDIRSRFILEKPIDSEVQIFFLEDEMMVINRKGQFYKAGFTYLLDYMVDSSIDKKTLQLQGNIHTEDIMNILEDSHIL